MRVIVTGFEPFGGERVNPSARAAEALAAAGIDGVTVTQLVLPVVRFRAVEMAVEMVERLRPEILLMLGEAGGRARIMLERVALNVDDFRMPDNGGHHPIDEAIVPGGPAAYFSTLPLKEMVQRMLGRGVPAAVSNSAGTYLCNHLSYGVLHHLALRRLPVRAGFIHLPYLPEQAAVRTVETPSMALETILSGLEAATAAVRDAVRGRLVTA